MLTSVHAVRRGIADVWRFLRAGTDSLCRHRRNGDARVGPVAVHEGPRPRSASNGQRACDRLRREHPGSTLRVTGCWTYSMQSNGASDLPEFPEPTPEERDALERVRELNRMTPAEFLEFLSQFTKNHP